MATIKSIPTFYKGYHFRSRLEARWAVFFDGGVSRKEIYKWEYEPETFNFGWGEAYLPDFCLHLNCGTLLYVEIKPKFPSTKEIHKAALLALHTKGQCNIYIGNPWGNDDGVCTYLAVGGCGEFPESTAYHVQGNYAHVALRTFKPGASGRSAQSARFEFGQSGATR